MDLVEYIKISMFIPNHENYYKHYHSYAYRSCTNRKPDAYISLLR